jgi:hypothetical protein
MDYDEISEDFCKEIILSLMKMQTLESMELILEILKKNPSSSRILPSIYPYLVKTNFGNHENSSSIQPALSKQGKFLYYVAEILSFTDAKEVDLNFTKELTISIDNVISSKNEFQLCHSPFLTLVLLAEFFQ